MRIILLALIMALPPSIALADIFDQADSNNEVNLLQAIQNDSRGYYYDSVTDYNFKPAPNDPFLSASTSGSLGCSGFDFNTNFINQFKLQALSDQVTSLAQQAVAASPMLLLEYASPTLADLLKHFNNITNLRLGMLYAQCEDIEQAVGDRLTKLRKESERECIEQAAGGDIDQTLKTCKQQKDPFSFLKDKDGLPLKLGGEISIVKDALERITLKDEEKEKMEKRIPEVKVTAAGVETINPEQEIEHVIAEKRKNYFNSLIEIYTRYANDPDSVSQADLDSISIPGVPITYAMLKDLSMLDKNDRLLKFAQIASSLASYNTVAEYENHILVLSKTVLDPRTQDFEREELLNNIEYLQTAIKRVEGNQILRDKHADILKDSISEADRRRLRALGELNTSGEYSKEAADTNIEKMLFIP